MADPNLQQNIQDTQQLVNLNNTLNSLLSQQQELIKNINDKLKNQRDVTDQIKKKYLNLENIADNLKKQNKDLLDIGEKQVKEAEEQNKKQEEQNKLVGKQRQEENLIEELLLEQLGSKKELTEKEQEILGRLKISTGYHRDQRDILRAINIELEGGVNYKKQFAKQQNILQSISERLLDDSEDLLSLSAAQLEKEGYKADKALQQLQFAYEHLENEIKEKRISEDKLNDQEHALLLAGREKDVKGNNFITERKTWLLTKQRLALQKQLNKDLGVYGATMKSVQKFAEKIGLSGIDEVFSKANKAATKKAKELYSANNSVSSIKVNLAAAGASMGVLAKGIGKSLLDPMFLITAQIAILKKAFEFYKGINHQITLQGRELAISYEESRKINESAYNYSLSLKDQFATQQHISEGRTLLNESLNTAIQYSNEESLEAKKLNQFYGLNAEQLGKMNILSAKNNKTITQTKNEILKTAVTQKAQFGGTLKYQAVVQKVNNISGDILTKFKGNVTALTSAVQQADRLGLTLEQVDKTGESLLNFEQSIQNELKAELLTGRQINVERARAAALSGNQIELMNELEKTVGNIHQFEQMNVLQRQAYAEVFGMTASEMGDMLRKKEFEAKYGKIEQENAQKILDAAKAQGATIDDTIKKDLERLSLQENMKIVMDKLKGILIALTDGVLEKMFKILEKVLNKVISIGSAFKGMTGGLSGDILGGVLLGLPTLILGARMLAGGIRSMILGPRGSSFANPVYSVIQGAGPGGMGPGGAGAGTGMMMWGGGGSIANKRALINQSGSSGAARNALMAGRGMRLGGAGAIAGLGVSAMAGTMAEGTAKDVVSTAGTALSLAGTGAMLGSMIFPGVGTVVGAALGGLAGIIGGYMEHQEKEDQKREDREKIESQQRLATAQLLEQLTLRPVKLTISNKEIGEFNTFSQQHSANGNF
jgi:hypothetical protein